VTPPDPQPVDAGALPDALACTVAGSGPRLVLAHGFTQNAGAWGPFADELRRRHEVAAVDLPGHGGSAERHGDLWTTARLVGEAGGPADYLGYSLGGRVCLHLALLRPDLVRRLVLIGAHAGLTDPVERATRRAADEARAARLDSSAPRAAGGRDRHGDGAAGRHDPGPITLDAFLDDWLSGPLFVTLAPEASQLAARRRNTAAGLAASLRECGTGTQDPLWDRLGQLTMPVLLLAGDLDARFAALAAQMADRIGPRARVELVPGAGHACHLECPAAVAGAVERFLA
jgi:2-succinyl-6-hydroxy-2,4-cyclohexadiene-1-carboxylate synthase